MKDTMAYSIEETEASQLLATELLGNKLFMHLLTERARRGEEITEDTILSALADERAVIVHNLERVSERSGRYHGRSKGARDIMREIGSRVYADLRV